MKAKENIKELLVLILMLILLFITQLTTSCVEAEQYMDPQLHSYWQAFEIEAAKRNARLPDKTLVMKLGQLGDRKGNCKWNKRTLTVTIDEGYFTKYTGAGGEYSSMVEATVFHELGHGLLGRSHTNICLDSVITVQTLNGPENIDICFPSSIMMRREADNGYVIMSNAHGYYEEHRDYYIDELFGLQ